MITQLTELESEERHKEANEQAMREARERIVELGFEWDKAVVERAKLVLRHQEALSQIGKAHTDLIEAKIQLIEAKSDIEGLKARNFDIMEKLEQEKLVVQQATDEATLARELGRGLSDKVRELISENPDKKDTYTSLAENKLAAEIGMDISAERANLELIHAANPNVIREFEKREQEIAKLTKKMDASNGKLATITQQLDDLMGKWEPKLDALVSKVNDALAYNFEQISCAGEVRVNKTEDFDQWALDIMVKFRYVLCLFLSGYMLQFKNTNQNFIEKTNPSNNSTLIANPAASAPSPPSSSSWPSNPWPSLPSASSTKSTRAWTPATNAWSTSAWSRLPAASTRASTSSSRPSCSRVCGTIPR